MLLGEPARDRMDTFTLKGTAVGTGAVPPSAVRMALRMAMIFSPYPAPEAQPLPWGFSFCPSYSTTSAQFLATYLNRGSMHSFFSGSVEA